MVPLIAQLRGATLHLLRRDYATPFGFPFEPRAASLPALTDAPVLVRLPESRKLSGQAYPAMVQTAFAH